MSTLKDTFEELHAKNKKIIDKAKSENRELTASEIGTFDANMDRMRSMNETFAREKKMDVRDDRDEDKLRAQRAFAASLEGNRLTFGGSPWGPKAGHPGGGGADNSEARAAVARYMLTGQGPSQAMDQVGDVENFTITSGTASGLLLPSSVDVPAIVRRQWNFVFKALAATGYEVINTSYSDNLIVPVFDDSAVTGDTPAENATTDVAADPSISTITLPASLYSSKSMWLSNTVIDAWRWDIVSYIMPLLRKRVDLAMDSAWTATLLAAQSSGNTVTCASDSAITYANVTDWFHAMPVQYRGPDSCFVVSDSLYSLIQKMVDSNGRPLLNGFNPAITTEFETMFGRPIISALNMPAVGANAIAGCFVNGEALKCRLCPPRIARYADQPLFPDQLGFRLFENGGFGVVAAGTAFLKMGAS